MTSDWTAATFDENFLRAEGLNFDARATAFDCDAISSLLKLQPGQRVLDLACGHGRHSLELARRGLGPLVGLDSSEAAIKLAVSRAAGTSTVSFVLSDMRALEFEAEFDAVFNVGNSLFYWDEATHQNILERVARALKPGGLLFLDVYNRDRLVGDLAVKRHPAVRFYNRARGIAGRVKRLFRPQKTLNPDRLRSSKTWNFDVETGVMHGVMRVEVSGGNTRETPIRTRLYTLTELRTLLERSGFVFEQVTGFGGEPIQVFTPRFAVLARKA